MSNMGPGYTCPKCNTKGIDRLFPIKVLKDNKGLMYLCRECYNETCKENRIEEQKKK